MSLEFKKLYLNSHNLIIGMKDRISNDECMYALKKIEVFDLVYDP